MALTGGDSRYGREIAPGVHIIGPIRRALPKGGYSKCYLFEGKGDSLTLVDTGWDADARLILGYLDDIGRSPEQITDIALTHAHRSHLGGVARLKELSHATVSCHANEAPIVSGARRAIPIALWPPRPVRLIPFRIISWLPIMKHVPCTVDRTIPDGEPVGPLKIIPTPGHTSGHLVFSYRDSVYAVGDAVATWPYFGAGWPGFNVDDAQYQDSLRGLIALRPRVVCPGHGEAIVEDTAARLDTLLPKLRRSRPRATA
jgi:glyoxylase-like metal-dependent hydrolase (beta-lactamase superfamily II)